MSATRPGGLGRREEPEPKMAAFPLAAAQAAPVAIRADHKRWARFAPILDQGLTGTCVGQTGESALLTGPVIHKRSALTPPTADDLYTLACNHDEWSQNDGGGDRYFGSSIRGLARGMRAAKLIDAFHWATLVDDCADWLAGRDADGKFVGGGLLLGVNWYDSMWSTDAKGFLSIPHGARIAGGHAIYCDEWNQREGWAGGPNSWGYRFGRVIRGRPNGRWRMSGETLQRLLSEDGEACAAVETRA